MRSLTAELAVLHRVSDRTMAARIAEAEALVSQFPSTLECLELGRIQLGHVRTIVEQGLAIQDADVRARYEVEVLEKAVSVTPGRLRRFAQLTATMPTVLAEGAWDRLTEQAQVIRLAGDPRSFDQIRSDLVAEVLLTGQPSGDPEAPHAAGVGIRAEVSVVIPVLTLLGRGAEPATITGKGPIDLETARKLAGGATRWLRVLTDPITDLQPQPPPLRPGSHDRLGARR
jgi:hypothetical protein